LAREWHEVLGEPPPDSNDRVAWIKAIADAPSTLEDAETVTPGVKALVEKLRQDMSPFESHFRFALDRKLLKAYSEWQAASGNSAYAQLLGIDQQLRSGNRMFEAFNRLAADPELAKPWATLIAHVRKRVLIDEYNMSPQLMYEYTHEVGPFDWRHPASHSYYWSRKGSQYGEVRVVTEDDIYKIVNNDRHQLHAMQDLARSGRMSFDPFSPDYPARFPDPRWIEVIDRWFEHFYKKHYETRGWGGDTFVAYHQNFLKSSIRELYRRGERGLAQRYLDRLNNLYGVGSKVGSPEYSQPLETFVWENTTGEYELQPHIAPSEVAASLYYGIVSGIGEGRPEVFEQSWKFAQQVTKWFKDNENNDFLTKFGTGRVKDLLGSLENSVYAVFADVVRDPSIPILERLRIYNLAPDWLQRSGYDQVLPTVQRQFQADPIAQSVPFDKAFPEPPGMALYRQEQARKAQDALKEQEKDPSNTIDRR
jgi:hypothetical protein